MLEQRQTETESGSEVSSRPNSIASGGLNKTLDMDMTSMADVTFLLLIFFMVTASFTLQQALEQPHSSTESIGPGKKIDSSFAQVQIDHNNTYYVFSPEMGEFECPSESEMRARIKEAFTDSRIQKLVIVADADSKHSRVVSAWDAGAIHGAAEIEIQVANELQ